MKNIFIAFLSVIFLLSCNSVEKAKPNSNGEAPETKKSEPIILQKKDPKPKTISIQEVSRIALVEAEQFITNAKQNDVDYSSVTETLEKAKKAYDNEEFKKAQKLAVSVRQQVETLINKL